MAHVENDRPDLLIRQQALRSRHAGRPKSVFDDPFELAIAIGLHWRGSERGCRRRHAGSERYAIARSIETMASIAVAGVRGASEVDICGSCGQWICLTAVWNEQPPLGAHGHIGLRLAGWGGPAAAQQGRGDEKKEAGYSKCRFDCHFEGRFYLNYWKRGPRIL